MDLSVHIILANNQTQINKTDLFRTRHGLSLKKYLVKNHPKIDQSLSTRHKNHRSKQYEILG